MSLFCSYLLYESLFLLQRVNGLGTFHENLTRDMTWLGDRGVGAGGGSGGLPSATTSSGLPGATSSGGVPGATTSGSLSGASTSGGPKHVPLSYKISSLPIHFHTKTLK